MSDDIEFIPPHPLNTAVLFLVFNRLDTTKQVFEMIKKAKPPRLYIAADGARASKDGESEKVCEVRDYILANIDWACDVETLFREQNLGCKMAVSGAINWFFEQEGNGIILEDDVLPSLSFFWYCEALLEKYSDDMRVWHVSGANIDVKADASLSYRFSIYPGIWGWATWANRWRKYDVNISDFTTDNLQSLMRNKGISMKFWASAFSSVSSGKVDTWDFQWVYTVWKNKGLSITPSKNLVTNIGFGDGATHTTDIESPLANLDRHSLEIESVPENIVAYDERDIELSNKYYTHISLARRVTNKILRVIKGMSHDSKN